MFAIALLASILATPSEAGASNGTRVGSLPVFVMPTPLDDSASKSSASDLERDWRYRAALLEQSRGLRLDIEALRKERESYGVGVPITMMAFGGALVLYSLVAASGADECTEHRECVPRESDWSSQIGTLFLGAVASVGGSLLLRVQVKSLIDLGRQIHWKKQQLELVEQPLLQAEASNQGPRGAALSLMF